MKDLFDHNDRYTPDANRLLDHAIVWIKPIVKEWTREGYSSRDIQTVLIEAVIDACIDHRLDQRNEPDMESDGPAD